jgi:hypothetical protein
MLMPDAMPNRLTRKLAMSELLKMMCFGANGSLASFISTRLNRMKKTQKPPKERTVRLSAQEELLPLSSPNKRKKTVRTRVMAPPKSTRISLVERSEESVLGRWRASETDTIARTTTGTWEKNALGKGLVSEGIFKGRYNKPSPADGISKKST